MSNHKLTTSERIAALEEQKNRLADSAALSEQIDACAKSRDDLADRLNEVIAERDELRAKVMELESILSEIQSHKYDE